MPGRDDAVGDLRFGKAHGGAFGAVEVGAGLDDLVGQIFCHAVFGQVAVAVHGVEVELGRVYHEVMGQVLWVGQGVECPPSPGERNLGLAAVSEPCPCLGFLRGQLHAHGAVRRGEALGLSWDDINLEKRKVSIIRQLQRSRGELLHRETKTPGSEAILPLPDICLTALQLRAERQAADRVRAGDIWHDTRLVFTTSLGTPYEPRNFARHFALRCSKAGVSHIRVHDTRRTCASLLVALNVHPRVAMQILRHSQIAITMQVYSEVPSEAMQKALRRLGHSLDGPAATAAQRSKKAARVS